MKIYLIGTILFLVTLVVYLIWWPDKYEIVNVDSAGEGIVCFGDSLTYGIGAAQAKSYPDQLAQLIGREITNAGNPGETTAGALARVDKIVALKPRMVLITLGGNDLKRGISKEEAFGNLELIVRKLQAGGALVVIGGLDLPFWGRGFGEEYARLARQTGSVLVPNVLEDIFGDAGLMSDRIHPNDKGYTIMAHYFYEAILPYL